MTYHVSYHVIMFQVYDYIIYFQHTGPVMLVESISDVSFVKIQHGQAVDVEDQDVIEVVRDIEWLL